MPKSFAISFLLLFLCISQRTSAQLPPSGITVNVDYLPASKYRKPIGEEKYEKTKASSSQQRVRFNGNFLLANKGDLASGNIRSWGITVNGSYTQMNNKGYEQKVIPGELLEIDAGIQHFRSLKNNWGLYSAVSVGLYTDMEKINGNDVFINGVAMFIKRKPKYAYGFGAGITNATGVPLILPGLFFQWQTGNKLKVNVTLPENISATYLLNQQTDLTLYFRPKFGVYDVENMTEGKRLMSFIQLPLGLEHTWHLKKLDLFYGGGIMPLRSFDYSDKSISGIFKNNPSHQLSANVFLNAGVRWNFR